MPLWNHKKIKTYFPAAKFKMFLTIVAVTLHTRIINVRMIVSPIVVVLELS